MRRKNGSVFPSLVYSTTIVRSQQVCPIAWVHCRHHRTQSRLRKSFANHTMNLKSGFERTAELAQSNKELTIEIAERLKMEQALQESKEQLGILASQIITAQENERKRISLEVTISWDLVECHQIQGGKSLTSSPREKTLEYFQTIGGPHPPHRIRSKRPAEFSPICGLLFWMTWAS